MEYNSESNANAPDASGISTVGVLSLGLFSSSFSKVVAEEGGGLFTPPHPAKINPQNRVKARQEKSALKENRLTTARPLTTFMTSPLSTEV
jgi:hypothetical protein